MHKLEHHVRLDLEATSPRALAVLRPQTRRAIADAAGFQRRRMKDIDQIGRTCAKADVTSETVRQCWRIRAQIDPELGIFLAEPDGRGPRFQFQNAERAEYGFVKARRRGKVTYRN